MAEEKEADKAKKHPGKTVPSGKRPTKSKVAKPEASSPEIDHSTPPLEPPKQKRGGKTAKYPPKHAPKPGEGEPGDAKPGDGKTKVVAKAKKESKPATKGRSKSTAAPKKAAPGKRSVADPTPGVPRTTSKAKSSSKKVTPKPPTDEEIAIRAYLLSEKRQQHGIPGSPESDWFQAQEELFAEAGLPSPGSNANPTA